MLFVTAIVELSVLSIVFEPIPLPLSVKVFKAFLLFKILCESETLTYFAGLGPQECPRTLSFEKICRMH